VLIWCEKITAGWLASQLNRVFCVGKTIDSDRTICENVDDLFAAAIFCGLSSMFGRLELLKTF